MANAFFAGLTSIMGDVGRARNAANIYASLSHLSDSQLAARGLKRQELSRVAFNRAFGGN